MAEESVAVAASAGQLGAIHAALDRFWAALEASSVGLPDGLWRAQFVTAVAEIAANIVRHAYPRGDEPGAMRLCLRAYPDRVEAHFDDRGIAFDPPIMDPSPDPLALDESGRGLAIARASVDHLDYRRGDGGVNEWRLLKRFARP